MSKDVNVFFPVFILRKSTNKALFFVCESHRHTDISINHLHWYKIHELVLLSKTIFVTFSTKQSPLLWKCLKSANCSVREQILDSCGRLHAAQGQCIIALVQVSATNYSPKVSAEQPTETLPFRVKGLRKMYLNEQFRTTGIKMWRVLVLKSVFKA